MPDIDSILKRLLSLHPKLMDLHLERLERLLELMGRPQDRLPPTIHVAGTNGKGSTIAFMRAFLEAAGKRVHVYTSPHLVHFNERIRLAGTLVDDAQLNAALEACEAMNGGAPITFFEITTAAAFKLFSEVPADYLLLEVGLGGEYDATNVVDHPLTAVITPVAIDHVAFLGDTVGQIANAKAGIIKRGAAAVFGRQSEEGLKSLNTRARFLRVKPFVMGEDFDGYAQNGRLVYQDEDGLLDLPLPRLIGAHQIDNAALAIATVRHLALPVSDSDIALGLSRADWPARLTLLKGRLRDLLPAGHELWLDGGHNAHGGAALSRALVDMERARPAPLVLIVGMMNTRAPADFVEPFRDMARAIYTLDIPGEINAHPAAFIAAEMQRAGFAAKAMPSVIEAISEAAGIEGARVVICGSLYLAGQVLGANGTPPN